MSVSEVRLEKKCYKPYNALLTDAEGASSRFLIMKMHRL